jgi:hypothetical protein
VNIRRVAFVLVTLAGGACAATPQRGESLDAINSGSYISIERAVAFDHGCAADHIRVIRTAESLLGAEPFAVDLDVCGVVRRYKSIDGTWLDVTSLYPAATLPQPLPPM